MPAPFVHLYIYTISQLRNTEHFTALCDITRHQRHLRSVISNFRSCVSLEVRADFLWDASLFKASLKVYSPHVLLCLINTEHYLNAPSFVCLLFLIMIFLHSVSLVHLALATDTTVLHYTSLKECQVTAHTHTKLVAKEPWSNMNVTSNVTNYFLQGVIM